MRHRSYKIFTKYNVRIAVVSESEVFIVTSSIILAQWQSHINVYMHIPWIPWLEINVSLFSIGVDRDSSLSPTTLLTHILKYLQLNIKYFIILNELIKCYSNEYVPQICSDTMSHKDKELLLLRWASDMTRQISHKAKGKIGRERPNRSWLEK